MSTYHLAPLGDALERVERIVEVDALATYPMLGVRSFGAGCFAAEDLPGSATRYQRLMEVRTDDIVYPKLMAWEGAFGIVSADLDHRFVSPEFCTFVARPDRAVPQYVAYVLRTPALQEIVAGASAGTNVRRRRLYPDDFLSKKVPLPDVEEQMRVVERLDAVSTRTSKIRALTGRARALATALLASLALRPDLAVDQRMAQGWARVALSEVLTLAIDSQPVEPSRSYPNVGILSFGRGLFEKSPIDGARTSATTLNRIRSGQFIFSRLFAFEGAYAAVPPRFDGSYVSGEFPTLDVDEERSSATYLAACFSSPETWQDLAATSKGLGVRRQRVHVESVLAYEIWLPPMGYQQSVVAQLARIEQLAVLRGRAETVIRAMDVSAMNAALVDGTANG